MKTARYFGLAVLLIAAGVAAFAGMILQNHSVSAAQNCTATVVWDKTSINPGDSATETWTVTGAASAIGTCTDGAGINSTVNNLSFGPQSYTFRNIQNSITCTVSAVTLDGQTCSSGGRPVMVNQSSGGGSPFTGSFPANGSYTIAASGASLQANFSYAPPVPAANFQIWSERGFDPLLGNFGKGLFGTAMAAPGPAFRWDVSDPLNIKGPAVVDLTSGPSGGNGPISNIGWAHVDHWNGSAVAESPEGDARYSEHLGLSRDIAVSYDGASGQGSFGGANFVGNSLSKALVYTPQGKFFAYGNSGKDRLGVNLGIYDLTDPSGSATDDISPAGTITWPGVGSLITLDMPDQGQFLIGINNATLSPPYKLKIGKIDSGTGKLTKTKNYSVAALDALTTGRKTSVLQAVAYNGKGYIFILESYGLGGGDAITGSLPNKMTLAIYELNPSKVRAQKINTLKINDLNFSSPFQFKVAGSPTGDAAPLLIVPVDKVMDGWDGSADLRVYNLQKALSGSVSTLSAGNADLVVPKTGPAKGNKVKGGEIIVNQTPFNAMLAKSGGKTYLNLFRNAYMLAGEYSGSDLPYGVYGGVTSLDNPIYTGLSLSLESGMAGPGTIRADQIDITSITGGTSNSGGSGGTGGGGGGGSTVTPPLVTDNECIKKYGIFCDQVTQLQKQICALVPTADICKTSTTGGTGTTGGGTSQTPGIQNKY